MARRAIVSLFCGLAIVTVSLAAVGAMPVLADEPARTSAPPTSEASLTPSPSASPSAEASTPPSEPSAAAPGTGSTAPPTPAEVPPRIEGSQGEGEGGDGRDDMEERSPRQAEGSVSVAAVDDEFQPTQLTVTVGTTVVWTNAGQNPHTVTAADRAFDSGTLESGETFSITFDEAGEVPYYCQIHGEPGSGMRGVIVVQAPEEEEEPGEGSPLGAPDVLAATGLDPMPLAIAALALAVAGLAAIRIGRRIPHGRR